jgi:hypothetical protein
MDEQFKLGFLKNSKRYRYRIYPAVASQLLVLVRLLPGRILGFE